MRATAAPPSSSAISTAKGRTRGAGAYCASSPPTTGPRPRPPTDATVEARAARRRSPAGSRSVSAAVSGPEAAPTAAPCGTRAANRHPVPEARVNSSDPSAAAPIAGSSTRRWPTASAAGSASSRAGISAATYAAKIGVTTSGEKPNVAA